jgi:tetratricopeptide (TPR) repeat protein
VAHLGQIPGLVVLLVAMSAVDIAVAQDTAWKDCERADRDPDRSIAACSKVLARSSQSARAGAFHNRGLAYAAKGNLDQAISDITAGIRLDPQRPYRWQERGELYARQRKYQQAVADITEAIRLDQTPRAFRFHNRAEAYQGLGDLTRAIADFGEAIRLDPVARSFRYHGRANALRDAGQYVSALADYETALKLAPTDAWLLFDRGRTYGRMGRSPAARNDFDAASKLDPSNEELQRAIEVELAAITPPSTVPPPRATSPTAPAQSPSQPALSDKNGLEQNERLKKAALMSSVRAKRVFIEEKLASIQFPALRSQAEEALSRLAEANADMPLEELEARSRDGNQVVTQLNEIEEFNRISGIATQRIKRITDELNSVVTDAPYLSEIKDAIKALKNV